MTIDNSGLINFAEFSGLWKYIEEWRTCFSAFDQDKSGSIDFNELKTAMRSFRYNLSDDFLRLIIKKYDKRGKDNSPVHDPRVFVADWLLWKRHKKSWKPWYWYHLGKKPEGRGDVSFDNFVQIAVTVKSLTDAFMRIDREGKGYATIGYEQVKMLSFASACSA